MHSTLFHSLTPDDAKVTLQVRPMHLLNQTLLHIALWFHGEIRIYLNPFALERRLLRYSVHLNSPLFYDAKVATSCVFGVLILARRSVHPKYPLFHEVRVAFQLLPFLWFYQICLLNAKLFQGVSSTAWSSCAFELFRLIQYLAVELIGCLDVCWVYCHAWLTCSVAKLYHQS